MKMGPINPANVPPGTYYFPEGTLAGNGRPAVNSDGMIPVYFKPKDGEHSSQGEEPEEDGGDDECDPNLRFSSRERWKKRRLMAKLRR